MNTVGKKKTPPLVKVTFFLDEKDWHGYGSESLWAEKISDNRCRLRNTPFYAKGVSFEDIVLIKRNGDKFYFDSVSLASGHSTYRIIVSQNVPQDVFQNYWDSLGKLGCTFESAEDSQKLLAVDIPPRANIYEVYALLEKGEKDGVWGFEEGHCGHSLN